MNAHNIYMCIVISDRLQTVYVYLCLLHLDDEGNSLTLASKCLMTHVRNIHTRIGKLHLPRKVYAAPYWGQADAVDNTRMSASEPKEIYAHNIRSNN
jgi:hypothetical protein